jgi:hypothetical protein
MQEFEVLACMLLYFRLSLITSAATHKNVANFFAPLCTELKGLEYINIQQYFCESVYHISLDIYLLQIHIVFLIVVHKIIIIIYIFS